jgi:hypothetical protein
MGIGYYISVVVALLVFIILYYIFWAPICIDLTNISSNFVTASSDMTVTGNNCVYHQVSPGVFAGKPGTVSDNDGNTLNGLPYLLIYKELVGTKTYYYALLAYAIVLNTSVYFALSKLPFEAISAGEGVIALNPDNGNHVSEHYIKRLGTCSLITAGTNVMATAAMDSSTSAATSKLTNKLSYGFGSLTIKVV